jgi:hypothetical protein
VLFQYLDMPKATQSWSKESIGFEDQTGQYGVQISYGRVPAPSTAYQIPASCHMSGSQPSCAIQVRPSSVPHPATWYYLPLYHLLQPVMCVQSATLLRSTPQSIQTNRYIFASIYSTVCWCTWLASLTPSPHIPLQCEQQYGKGTANACACAFGCASARKGQVGSHTCPLCLQCIICS